MTQSDVLDHTDLKDVAETSDIPPETSDYFQYLLALTAPFLNRTTGFAGRRVDPKRFDFGLGGTGWKPKRVMRWEDGYMSSTMAQERLQADMWRYVLLLRCDARPSTH